MAIPFHCETCGHDDEAPEEYAGRRIKCPRCKTPLRLGSLPEQPAPPPFPEGWPGATAPGAAIAAKGELRGQPNALSRTLLARYFAGAWRWLREGPKVTLPIAIGLLSILALGCSRQDGAAG